MQKEPKPVGGQENNKCGDKKEDEENLKETDFFYEDRNYRAFIAVYVGDVRLIDNMHLD